MGDLSAVMWVQCQEQDQDDLAAFLGNLWPEHFTVVEYLVGTDASSEDVYERACEALRDFDDPVLTVFSDGFYHHYTYGFVRRVAERSEVPFGYIHIDGHPDVDTEEPGDRFYSFTCGSFVDSILRDDLASEMLFVGHHASNGPVETLRESGKGKLLEVRPPSWVEGSFLESVESCLDSLPESVYLTIDLDVLKPEYARTGWPNGEFELEELLEVVDLVKAKNLLGIDICGLRGHSYPKHRESLLSIGILVGRLLGEDTERLEEELYHQDYTLEYDDLLKGLIQTNHHGYSADIVRQGQ